MNPPYVLLTAAYCAAIFFFSSSANPVELSGSAAGFDKAVHAVLYAGLAATVSVGIRRSRPGVRPSVQFVAPVLFSTLYALSDEFHQLFVPGRHSDPWDVAADVTGAFVVQMILCVYAWRIWD